MLANPFNWRVRWPRPARVPLFSLGLKVPRRSIWPQREAVKLIIANVRLETRYIDIEKSILIIDQNFHIDFISSISIICGNTRNYHDIGPLEIADDFARCLMICLKPSAFEKLSIATTEMSEDFFKMFDDLLKIIRHIVGSKNKTFPWTLPCQPWYSSSPISSKLAPCSGWALWSLEP